MYRRCAVQFGDIRKINPEGTSDMEVLFDRRHHAKAKADIAIKRQDREMRDISQRLKNNH